MLFGRLLNRAILSHLIVAVPPAFFLGQMVIDINAQGLRQEAHQLHLSLAGQVRDAVRSRVEVIATLVGHAERILDLRELPVATRQEMLRALVAEGELDYLALYRPDGVFDSLVSERGEEPNRAPLSPLVRSRAAAIEWTVWVRGDIAQVVRPWRRGDEVLGFIASPLGLDGLRSMCRELALRHLGESGWVDVVGPDNRYVLSSEPDHIGSPNPRTSPFSGIEQQGRGGLTLLAAGVAHDFTDVEGEPWLTGLVSDPRLGWLVAASRPERVALGVLARVRLRVVLMSICAALAAGLVGLLMARQITGPVQRLVRAVQRAAQKGFAADARVSASGELGQLAQAFNQALAEMADYRRQLQRTTQLRMRLARLGSPEGGARDLLARATRETTSTKVPESMSIVYVDIDVAFIDRDATETENLVTILGEFFSAADEAIRQEGGRVDRYSGDAVIGVFVAARLPDARRAALAAARTVILDAEAIRARWSGRDPLTLVASAGVVSGQAWLIDGEGGDSPDEPTVQGPLVEAAAELQRQALPGTIVADAATRAADPEGFEPLETGGAQVFARSAGSFDRAPTR